MDVAQVRRLVEPAALEPALGDDAAVVVDIPEDAPVRRHFAAARMRGTGGEAVGGEAEDAPFGPPPVWRNPRP